MSVPLNSSTIISGSDVDNIVTLIRSNKGSCYYNISTGKWVKTATIRRMINVNFTYKIAANKGHKLFFNNIIRFLEENVNSTSEYDNYVLDSNDPDYVPSNMIQRKKLSPKTRQTTWETYIGNSIEGKCWSCDRPICYSNWHAGHVKAHSKGGSDTVDNLRPLCPPCNWSMSNMHMAKFIRKHCLTGQGALEFGILSMDLITTMGNLTV